MKFDQPRINSILKMISQHVPYKKACLANGVSEQVFYQWIASGERDLKEQKRTKYTEFLESLNKIEAERIISHISNIQDDGNGHKGSQWILERVFWKYFSAKAAEIELNERVSELEQKRGNENVVETKADEGEEKGVSEEVSSNEEIS